MRGRELGLLFIIITCHYHALGFHMLLWVVWAIYLGGKARFVKLEQPLFASRKGGDPRIRIAAAPCKGIICIVIHHFCSHNRMKAFACWIMESFVIHLSFACWVFIVIHLTWSFISVAFDLCLGFVSCMCFRISGEATRQSNSRGASSSSWGAGLLNPYQVETGHRVSG